MNYDFCDDLDTPEICVIMNRIWWINNRRDILEFLGESDGIVEKQLLFIPDAPTRTMFMLKWPQV